MRIGKTKNCKEKTTNLQDGSKVRNINRNGKNVKLNYYINQSCLNFGNLNLSETKNNPFLRFLTQQLTTIGISDLFIQNIYFYFVREFGNSNFKFSQSERREAPLSKKNFNSYIFDFRERRLFWLAEFEFGTANQKKLFPISNIGPGTEFF